MPRLIDADKFIRNFSTWMNRRDEEHGDSNFVLGIKLMLEELQNAPTIDAVEVVRCKDCRHEEHWYGDKGRCFLWVEDGISVFEDGYCNYGKKREDADLYTDNRFELIEKYKQILIDATNIEADSQEMAVIDNILFRFWQMGWLDRLDAEPVRHGHWINHFDDLFPEDSSVECSVCHEYEGVMANDNYCPNCGARMDEGIEDAKTN